MSRREFALVFHIAMVMAFGLFIAFLHVAPIVPLTIISEWLILEIWFAMLWLLLGWTQKHR